MPSLCSLLSRQRMISGMMDGKIRAVCIVLPANDTIQVLILKEKLSIRQ